MLWGKCSAHRPSQWLVPLRDMRKSPSRQMLPGRSVHRLRRGTALDAVVSQRVLSRHHRHQVRLSGLLAPRPIVRPVPVSSEQRSEPTPTKALQRRPASSEQPRRQHLRLRPNVLGLATLHPEAAESSFSDKKSLKFMVCERVSTETKNAFVFSCNTHTHMHSESASMHPTFTAAKRPGRRQLSPQSSQPVGLRSRRWVSASPPVFFPLTKRLLRPAFSDDAHCSFLPFFVHRRRCDAPGIRSAATVAVAATAGGAPCAPPGRGRCAGHDLLRGCASGRALAAGIVAARVSSLK